MSYLVAIATSFVASIVFFFFFEYIPRKTKYRKIRPRIEVELIEIANQLFFVLDTAMQHSEHSPSFFQQMIREGTITEDEFENGLYNKCLNQSYLFDENANKLMPVGTQLQNKTDLLSIKIRQVLMNQEYLSAEEILIIEDVDRILHEYDYNFNAITKLGQIELRPVNPTISYMHHMFFQLFEQYDAMRNRVYKYKYIKYESRQGKNSYYSLKKEYIMYLLGKHQTEDAKRAIRKLEFSKDAKQTVGLFLNYAHLRYYIETGMIEKAADELHIILNSPYLDKLVYERGYLQYIRDYPELMSIVRSHRSTEEIDYWNTTVDREEKQKSSFVLQNKELKEYYRKRETANRNADKS